MKLDKFVKEEELKDYISYVVKQSKNSSIVYDDNIVDPACKALSKVLTAYDEILEEEGEKKAANYGFKILVNYVTLTIQIIEDNLQLKKKLKEKEDE